MENCQILCDENPIITRALPLLNRGLALISDPSPLWFLPSSLPALQVSS